MRIDEEHHVVDFVSHTWQIIQFKSFLVHIIRYSFHVSEREGGKAFDWVLIARMRPGRVGGGVSGFPLVSADRRR